MPRTKEKIQRAKVQRRNTKKYKFQGLPECRKALGISNWNFFGS
jgi:hypothetical protein